MKTLDIKQKLTDMGVDLDTVVMGDFDYIGKFTAERNRRPDEPNYKKYGTFFRANYERGILVYNLIRQYELTSVLEVGFGRGYVAFCAAKAFHDAGIQGQVTTIDLVIDEKFIQALQQVFPQDWFKYLRFAKGPSQQILPQLNQQFELIYIDGDHSYEGTKSDWEQTKGKFTKFMLFDDYHLPSKNDPGIQCSKLIDEIDEASVGCDGKELILMDRLMFRDDRGETPLDYGQVLLTKSGTSRIVRDDW
jgi:methyltransferase family protein